MNLDTLIADLRAAKKALADHCAKPTPADTKADERAVARLCKREAAAFLAVARYRAGTPAEICTKLALLIEDVDASGCWGGGVTEAFANSLKADLKHVAARSDRPRAHRSTALSQKAA